MLEFKLRSTSTLDLAGGCFVLLEAADMRRQPCRVGCNVDLEFPYPLPASLPHERLLEPCTPLKYQPAYLHYLEFGRGHARHRVLEERY